MGVGNSTPPDLQRVPDAPVTWDAWGYRPQSIGTSAQTLTALSYVEGAAAWGATKSTGGRAIANDPLAFLGTDSGGLQKWEETSKCWKTFSGGCVPQVGFNFPDKVTWYDSNYCTPENFPHCDMGPMGYDSPSYSLWNGKGWTLPPNPIGMSKAIDMQVDAYSNDQLAYVDWINSGDTTGEGPADVCDGPTLLDQLIPIAGAAAGYYLVSVYFKPELAALQLSDLATKALQLNALMVGWYIGHQVVAPFGTDTRDGYNAGMAIAHSAGFMIGSYITLKTPYTQYELLGGLAGSLLLANTIGLPFAEMLDNVVWAASTPFKAVTSAWRAITRWICRWTATISTQCDNFEEYPDARMWGTPELAAKLVDELCQEEGWTRSSPQARYAMTALLMTPAWQMAAQDTQPTSSNYDKFAINPVGQLVPYIMYSKAKTCHPHKDTGGWTVMDIANPDGGAYGDVGSTANSDAVMCQQWDLLKAGTANPVHGADPTLSKKFAETMQTWKEAVRKSAQDPENWVRAEAIPGMSSYGGSTVFMTPQQYLENCRYSKAEGGFDTYAERGRYAQVYTEYVMNLRQWKMSPMEKVLIQLNQMIDGCKDINDYYHTLVAAGVTGNICGALNYMLVEPEPGPQRADWYEWSHVEELDPHILACKKDAVLKPPLYYVEAPVPVRDPTMPRLETPGTLPLLYDPKSPEAIQTNNYLSEANAALPNIATQYDKLVYWWNTDDAWGTWMMNSMPEQPRAFGYYFVIDISDSEAKTNNLAFPPLGYVVTEIQNKVIPVLGIGLKNGDFTATQVMEIEQSMFDMIWAWWASGLDHSGTMTSQLLSVLNTWDSQGNALPLGQKAGWTKLLPSPYLRTHSADPFQHLMNQTYNPLVIPYVSTNGDSDKCALATNNILVQANAFVEKTPANPQQSWEVLKWNYNNNGEWNTCGSDPSTSVSNQMYLRCIQYGIISEADAFIYPDIEVVVEYVVKYLDDFADNLQEAQQAAFDIIWTWQASGLNEQPVSAATLATLNSWNH